MPSGPDPRAIAKLRAAIAKVANSANESSSWPPSFRSIVTLRPLSSKGWSVSGKKSEGLPNWRGRSPCASVNAPNLPLLGGRRFQILRVDFKKHVSLFDFLVSRRDFLVSRRDFLVIFRQTLVSRRDLLMRIRQSLMRLWRILTSLCRLLTRVLGILTRLCHLLTGVLENITRLCDLLTRLLQILMSLFDFLVRLSQILMTFCDSLMRLFDFSVTILTALPPLLHFLGRTPGTLGTPGEGEGTWRGLHPTASASLPFRQRDDPPPALRSQLPQPKFRPSEKRVRGIPCRPVRSLLS